MATSTAFLFPGQGSQRAGMAGDLQRQRPDLFEAYLGRAEVVAGLPLRELCLEAPLEALTATEVAQPALFAMSLALHEVAVETGLRANAMAGHSLGEYSAAVAAGALSFEDGLALVCERGQLMAGVQAESAGAMGAVLGLTADAVEGLCTAVADYGWVAPANLNAPTQIVVSGKEPAVAELLRRAEAAGASKAVRLQVGAAFHSRFMEPVRDRLAASMQGVAWRDPDVPLVVNHAGTPATRAQEVHHALITQIASPVRWVQCVTALLDGGSASFLELGPGRVLTGLVRQSAPSAIGLAADSPKKVEQHASKLARTEPATAAAAAG